MLWGDKNGKNFMQIKIKKNIYNEEDIIKFGKKHKFEKIKDVLKIDPSYLIWCHENESFNFELTPKVYNKAKKENDKRKKALFYVDGPPDFWVPTEEELLGHFPGDA